MINIRKSIYILFQVLSFTLTLSAQIPVGTWRDHLPYYAATSVVNTGKRIVCSSPYALFDYNPSDYSINKLSRTNGLSDVGISDISFDNQTGILMVAYENANIDIIKDNSIFNLSDIKNKQIQGDKKIYQVVFSNKKAYLACGFGIVLIDTEKKEISDTWYIGPNGSSIDVLSIAFDDNYIYAATGSGIYRGQKDNPLLIDYNQWEKMTNLPEFNGRYTQLINYNGLIFACLENSFDKTSIIYRQDPTQWSQFYNPAKHIHRIRTFNNKLFIVEEKAITVLNENGTIDERISDYGFAGTEPNDVCRTNDGSLCIADSFYGLVYKSNSSAFQSFIPNGPYNNHVWHINAQPNQVIIAGGGHTSFGGSFGNFGELYTFSNDSWKSTVMWTSNARDLSCVLINPNKPAQVFAGAWGAGVYVFENGQLTNNYNETNSSLQSIFPGQDYIRIGGLLLDASQNLYVTNVGVGSPISVKTPGDEWYSYNYPELAGQGDVAAIIETIYGHKWVQVARNGGLFAFDDNRTLANIDDDLRKRFSIYDETGQFVTNEVFSLAEDHDGVIWVGTDMGVLTYYNPSGVFTDDAFYASRVKVVDKNNPDIVQYLLSKEKITAIAIDGANRKWFGTESSGVFLMSENCEEEIFHFTRENSKLLSNQIISIAIEPKSGEVFFGTDLGIISYKSTATAGDDLFSNAYVYPNPVRENYHGLITITGLAANVDVKITDIAGQIVYQTKAFGGQAVWNGLNHSGRRVQTGVYMVFCTDETGLKTKVLKLLFIN